MDRFTSVLVVVLASVCMSVSVRSTATPARWSVNQDGVNCILATMEATFDVEYRRADKSIGTATINMPVNQTEVNSKRSSCQASGLDPASMQVLSLWWAAPKYNVSQEQPYNYNLTITFSNNNNIQTITDVEFEYDTRNNRDFVQIDQSLSGQFTAANSTNVTLGTGLGKSYQCLSRISEELRIGGQSNVSVTITTYNTRIEAFHKTADSAFDEVGSVCDADRTSTTTAPSTTTQTVTTTTTTSTTTASTTTTTTASPTTTAVPIPAKWSVNQDGVNCVLATMDATFQVEYRRPDKSIGRATINMPVDQTTVNTNRSSCRAGGRYPEAVQVLSLWWAASRNDAASGEWPYHYNVTIKFMNDNNNVQTVTDVEFEYDMMNNKDFGQVDQTLSHQYTAVNTTNVSLGAGQGKSYKCYSKMSEQLKVAGQPDVSVTITTFNARIEAFHKTADSTYDEVVECEADRAVTTTSSPVTTTSPHSNINLEVKYPGNDTDCIHAQFDLAIGLIYYNVNGTQQNGSQHEVNNVAYLKDESNCSMADGGQKLAFQINANPYNDWKVYLTFYRDTSYYWLRFVNVTYNLKNLPNTNDTMNRETDNDMGSKYLYAGNGYSYTCANRQFDLNVDTRIAPMMYVRLDNLKVQAFMNNNTNFDQTSSCSSVGPTSDVVPIAVGCALAGLVVIVLIAYLIGRRRNRARGYESM